MWHMAIARYTERIRSYPAIYHLMRVLYRLVIRRPKKEGIEQAIGKALRKMPNAVFVQVGSNDGVSADPIRDLILANEDWRGIFIEPLRQPFERLRNNYGNEGRFIFVNAAVSDTPGMRRMYYVSEDARTVLGEELPWYSDLLGSFDRQHIVKHFGGRLAPYIREEQVKCMALSDILLEYGVERIDLLHIDVEGYDYNVLTQVNYARYSPAVILYEHIHLSSEDRKSAIELLKGYGYGVTEYSQDTLALYSSTNVPSTGIR